MNANPFAPMRLTIHFKSVNCDDCHYENYVDENVYTGTVTTFDPITKAVTQVVLDQPIPCLACGHLMGTVNIKDDRILMQKHYQLN